MTEEEKDNEFNEKLYNLCKEYEKIGIWISSAGTEKGTAIAVLPPIIPTEQVVDILNSMAKFVEKNYKPVELPDHLSKD